MAIAVWQRFSHFVYMRMEAAMVCQELGEDVIKSER